MSEILELHFAYSLRDEPVTAAAPKATRAAPPRPPPIANTLGTIPVDSQMPFQSAVNPMAARTINERAAKSTLGNLSNPIDARRRAVLGLPALTREQKMDIRKRGLKAGSRKHRRTSHASTFRRSHKH